MNKMHDQQSVALVVRNENESGVPAKATQNTKSGFSMNLGMKIGSGFAIVTLILIGAVVTTIVLVGSANRKTTQLIELRTPTIQASLGLLNGMNHSLAALRGWIILGKDKFKDERANAWSNEIDRSFGVMKKLSVNWTDPGNIERLNAMEQNLADFRRYQREIEDIAQKVDNTPALKILFEQAAPQASILTTSITKMIDLEVELEATAERKALLGMMADVRGTTGLGIANIRAFLISGDEKFKKKFDKLWAKNTRRFGDLTSNINILSPEQLVAYNEFSKSRKIFELLPPKMFKIRGSAEWNLANAWLGTKAAPTAFAIKEKLDAMLSSQHKLLATDKAEVISLMSFLTTIEWVLLGAGIFLSAIVGTFITRSITKPVTETVSVLSEIASGDFTKEVTVRTGDEIGVLGHTVNTMVRDLRKLIAGIKETGATIASSSEELSNVSTQMAGGSEEIASQSNNVAGATEQMSSNINTMASASEEMSVNISTVSSNAEQMSHSMNTVASAIEEMSASINDVEKNAREASKVANEATEMATSTTETMNALGTSANEIGNVTEVIKRIAEQTNLLALNATIEAASAGDAGKGFAVVANEIKELANQSAHAAEDIATKIDGVQGNVSEAVTMIAKVVDIIVNINKSVGVINEAIAEQTRAANDISSNVSEANTGVGNIAASIGEVDKGANDMSKNAAEAAKAANEVSSNIQGVNQAATEGSASAQQVKASVSELAKIASDLQEMVAKFQV